MTSSSYSWQVGQGESGEYGEQGRLKAGSGEDKHKEVNKKKTVGKATGGWARGSGWQSSVKKKRRGEETGNERTERVAPQMGRCSGCSREDGT